MFQLRYIILLALAIYHVCVAITNQNRHFQCFQNRLMGQSNCSPCVDFYVFNRTVNYRRCEHVNGRCFPFRTVFPTARACEDTCRPYIEGRTLEKPQIIEPKLSPGNSCYEGDCYYDDSEAHL